MNIQIISRDFKLKGYDRDFIMEKIEDEADKYLKNFAEDMKNVRVKVIKIPRNKYKMNLNMKLPGKGRIFAETSSWSVESAVIKLREKFRRQVKSYLGKLRKR